MIYVHVVVERNIKTVADRTNSMVNVEIYKAKIKELKGILQETGHSL